MKKQSTSYQIGNKRVKSDDLKRMSGTDANALYYATHQGNKAANTVLSNTGSYVDTGVRGSLDDLLKKQDAKVVNQYRDYAKNVIKANNSKKEVPTLEKPKEKVGYVSPKQKEQNTINKYATKSQIKDAYANNLATKLATKQNIAKQGAQENSILDYYQKRDLEEERSNLWNKGADMTDIESKRLKDINSRLKADETARSLKARNLDENTKASLNKEAEQYFNQRNTKKGNLTSNRQNEKAFRNDMQAKYGYSSEQLDSFLNQYKSDSNPNRKEWLVSRDKYDTLMQNQQMRSDIDALAMAYANDQGTRGRGIRALQNKGYRNVNDYVQQLSRRYELTEDELNDIVKTYMSDREQEQSQKLYNKLYNLGQENEAIGTILPMLTKGMSGVEGYYNVLANAMTGDERNQSHLMNALATGSQAGVADEIDNDLARGAYNLGVGAGGAVFNALGGGMGIAAQSGNAANEAMNSAIERGVDPRQAAAYGMVAGLTDYLFNRKGFEAIEKRLVQKARGSWWNILKQSGKNAAANFGIEGGENVAQDIVQSIADQIINGKNGELTAAYADNLANGMSEEDAFFDVVQNYAEQTAMSFLQGGVAGAAFGGMKDIGGNALGGVVGKVLKNKAETQSPETNKLKEDALAKRAELAGQTADIPRVGEEPSLLLDNTTDNEQAAPIEYINEARKIHKLPDNIAEIANSNRSQIKTMNPVATVNEGMFKDGDGKLAEKVSDYYKSRNNLAHNDVLGDVTLTKKNLKGSVYHNKLTRRKVDTFAAVPDVIEKGKIVDYQPAWKGRDYDTALIVAPVNIVNADGISEEYITGVIVRRNKDMQKFYTHDAVSIKKGDPSLEAREISADTPTGGEGSPLVYNILRNLANDKLNYEDGGNVNSADSNTATSQTRNNSIKQRQYDNYNKLRATIDNNRLVQNVKFDNDVDRIAYDAARKDLFAKTRAFTEALETSDADTIRQAEIDIENAYKKLKELASKGYVNDKTNQAELRKIKKDFANKTKGVVINLPDDMRSELGIKDETINGLNRRMSTLGGNDYIKFSKNKGTPIDQIWTELVDASGNQLSDNALNNADMVTQLIEYVDGLKVDGKGIERIPADIDTFIPDSFWDEQYAMSSEAMARGNHPVDIDMLNEDETGSPTLAEDTGLNPENNIDIDWDSESVEEPIQRGNYKGSSEYSQFATNSAIGAGIINQEMLDTDPVLADAAKKEVHSNAKTYAAALEDAKNHGDEWYNKVVNGDYILGQPKKLENGDIDYERADQDFDEGMIILQNLESQIESATDDATRQALTAKRNALFRKMRQFSSNAGRVLQAHVKWANTADGAIMTGDKMLGEATDAWTSRNQKAVKTNRRLAEALKQQGYDGSMDNIKTEPPTLAELKEQVRNTLAKEFASVEDQFSDSDIDYLAGLLSQNASVSELVDALNTKMATGTFGVSADTQVKVNDLFKAMDMFNPESKEYADLQLEAFRLIANETKTKASALDKFDAWRYLAMLGNPKTMIRNWVGNQIFGVVTGVKNNVAALGEMGVDAISRATGHEGIERTKAFINPFDRQAIKSAQTDFNKMRYQSGAGTKYKDTKSAIQDATSVFDSKLAQFWEKLTDAGISDTSAVRRKYATSLLGYMKANGLTDADMDASYRYDDLYRQQRIRNLTDAEVAEMESLKPTADAMEKARDYALKEADYATFHEDNGFAKWLSETSQKGTVAKILVEGLVPFKKTPANVLRSGVEFSPFNAIASIAKTGKLIYENTGKRKDNLRGDTYKSKNGKKDIQRTLAADVIDSWSKTLTGSGLAMLGYYLFNKGILKSSRDDEKYQDQLEGLQNYSIEINGHTYTIDWAAPAVMPLLLGAEISKVFNDNAIPSEEGYSKAGQIVDTINALLQPVMETSMLQGINDTFTTAANQINSNNGTKDAIAGILGAAVSNMATGYVTQAIPTISGQFARALDGTRRTTDTVNNGLVGVLEKQGRKIMNKTPFLSRLNTPYRDARGETQSNNPLEYNEGEYAQNFAKFLPNLAYQMASPGYLDKIDTRASDTIARNAYNALDANGKPIRDADVFADWKSQVKINGQKLTPEQMEKYREAGYTERTKVREELAQSDWFNQLSGEDQTEILKSTNTLADQIGKSAADPDYTSKSEVYSIYQSSGIDGVLEYYQDKAHKNEVKSALGTSSEWATAVYDSGNQKDIDAIKEAQAIADEMGFDLSENDYLHYKRGGKWELKKELGYKQKAADIGVNDNKFVRSLIDSNVSDKTIQKASDEITSVISGQDEFGRDEHLTMNKETYDVWDKYGKQGLDEYVKIKGAGANWNTYHQAKRFYPSMTVDKYISTFNSLDGKAGSKADGKISQDELVQYYNSHNVSAADADKMWSAYGDEDWKYVPVVKENKKTGKTEWAKVKKK